MKVAARWAHRATASSPTMPANKPVQGKRRDRGRAVRRARDLRQRGGRGAEQQRRGDAPGSERPAKRPCATRLIPGRLRAQPEGDPAHDDRHHGERKRRQEDSPEGRESCREGGEQDRDREDQPDVVCLPQRSDRARDRGALLGAVAGGQVEDPGPEIRAGQDRVSGQDETQTDRDEVGQAHQDTLRIGRAKSSGLPVDTRRTPHSVTALSAI